MIFYPCEHPRDVVAFKGSMPSSQAFSFCQKLAGPSSLEFLAQEGVILSSGGDFIEVKSCALADSGDPAGRLFLVAGHVKTHTARSMWLLFRSMGISCFYEAESLYEACLPDWIDPRLEEDLRSCQEVAGDRFEEEACSYLPYLWNVDLERQWMF